MTAWYMGNGPESDVILSSRIRLARNLNNIPFPARMNKEQAEHIIEICKDAILNSNTILSREFEYISMQKISVVDKQALVEKHLISPAMLQDEKARGVLISRDEKISIMINEEDHLRIQCLFPGLQLDEAWDLGNKIDDIMEESVEYAYHENYGYLTCCPTNAGTGLRASVMIHLPALAITGQLNNLLSAVTKLGFAVRGLYGEGSEARGNIFQISNQITLGISEEATISNLKGIIKQIIDQERGVRNQLLRTNRIQLEDKLYRSYGILSSARIMSSEEFMKLFSDVRLGVNLGIIGNIPIEAINELMVITQPANILKIYGENLTPEQRDIRRAELIREKLGVN